MYEDLSTEEIDPAGPELDLLAPGDVARLLYREELRAAEAVGAALEPLGRAAGAAADALARGGRLIYAGAGTSGRLGVLDAAEMIPTFGAVPGQVVALLAGGDAALVRAVEGAEDDAEAGRREAAALDVEVRDCVVGITMSGTAAYVGGVLDEAGRVGATRVLVTAADGAGFTVEHRIRLELGPELLAGSSRLKGGSATKLVLNALSTAAMARNGAVYRNMMVRVRPTNRKLRDRAERLVARLADIDRNRAARLLVDAGDEVPVAVLMARKGYSRDRAEARLAEAGGSLREALS